MSKAFILVGITLAFLMQIGVFWIALSKAPGKALMCLIIPFYLYVYAKKEPHAKPWLWAWYAGIGLLIVGVIAAN